MSQSSDTGGVPGSTREAGAAGSGTTIAPLDARLGHLIKRAEHSLITAKERLLRLEELSVTQYSALLVLAESPGATGAQVARRCLVTPQSMVPVLASLEDRGFIERRPSTVHAKVYEITLTDKGMDKLKRADLLAGALERRLAVAFNGTEHRQLRDLLERAIEVLIAGTADTPASPKAVGR
jgi:DNA-binding MarR family transcriptional regulator